MAGSEEGEGKKVSLPPHLDCEGLLNYYIHEGLNLIPLIHGDKKPAITTWKEYQQRKITKEEINTFFLQGTQHNIGVVCGAISDNLYVLDFDTEEIFHKFFTKTDGLIVVKTGRGYHVYFKAESSVKTLKMLDSEEREIATLKGEGSYVVGPPSLHSSRHIYEFIQRGEIPKLTGDVRQQVKERAIEIGLTVPKDKIDLETLLKGVPAGNRDNSLMYLIHFLRRAGISKEDALKICKAWNKRNKPPLEDVSGKVDYHYGLAESYRYFYSFDPGLWNITEALTPEKKKKSKAPKEEKEVVIQTSIVEKDGTLYEEIYNNGDVSFIDCEGNTYDTLEVGGLKYVPIFGDELTEGAVLLPSGLESYKDEKTLIEEIKTHIHSYIEISPFFETIAAYYVLLSWLYDEINTLPYLRVLGDTGTGKSRFLDTVGRLCYKATSVSGAITPAPIYRLIRKWHGTIIIDEGDFRASDEQNEVVKILNCGFERGRPVVRSQKDNPDNLQILPTFSPKIIASRKRFKDIALESRCLTEITKETDREDIPYLLPLEFYKSEEKLRNKLLLFRFQNRGKVDIEKAQGLKYLDVENRLKQAVSSFIVLFANNEEVYKDFTEFLTAYNRELVEERADTIEGAIINAISEIINERTSRTQSLSNVQNDLNVLFTNEDLKDVYITATDITELLKENYGLHDVTSRGVGKRLKTLGMTSKKKGTGAERRRYLDLEERSLAKLIKKYIPISVDETDKQGVLDVYIGEREDKIKSYSPVEEAICELCGKKKWLNHEWTHEGKKHLICAGCAEELKEKEEEKKEKLKVVDGSETKKKELTPIEIKKIVLEVGKCKFCGNEEIDLIYVVHYSNDEFKNVCEDCGQQLMKDYGLKVIGEWK